MRIWNPKYFGFRSSEMIFLIYLIEKKVNGYQYEDE